MKLVRLTPDLEPAVREVAAEYRRAGDPRFDEIEADYAGMVETLARSEREAVHALGIRYTFFLARIEDGTIVGTIRLRHDLNDRLWQNGGHVGYDVRPSRRNQGHATRMLALVLDEARALGLPWLLLTVDPENAASIRVIEKNGGTRSGVAEKTGYLRYRIELDDAR